MVNLRYLAESNDNRILFRYKQAGEPLLIGIQHIIMDRVTDLKRGSDRVTNPKRRSKQCMLSTGARASAIQSHFYSLIDWLRLNHLADFNFN